MSTTPAISLTREPTGNVVAEGGDELAVTLLKRAGFVIETTPRSFWYRLPWDLGEERERRMASHAARMLTAVGYEVGLDPVLDVTRITTPTDPDGIRVYGQQVLSLTDQLNGADTYEGAADLTEHVLNPDDGVLVRLGDFFEAAAAQANASDTPDGWDVSHVFEDAAATVRDLVTDLHPASAGMRALGPPRKRSWQEGVASYYATAPTSRTTTPSAAHEEPSAAPTSGRASAEIPVHRRNR